MSRAILTIEPHSPSEKKLMLSCRHGRTTAYYGDGSLKLTDDDLGRLLGHSHRVTFGCRCSDATELVYPATTAAN